LNTSLGEREKGGKRKGREKGGKRGEGRREGRGGREKEWRKEKDVEVESTHYYTNYTTYTAGKLYCM